MERRQGRLTELERRKADHEAPRRVLRLATRSTGQAAHALLPSRRRGRPAPIVAIVARPRERLTSTISRVATPPWRCKLLPRRELEMRPPSEDRPSVDPRKSGEQRAVSRRICWCSCAEAAAAGEYDKSSTLGIGMTRDFAPEEVGRTSRLPPRAEAVARPWRMTA